MAEKTLYMIYHKDCGHPICVFNDRRDAQSMLSLFMSVGRWRLRIRAGDVSDDELVLIARGHRCGTCAFDGQVSHV